MNRERPTKQQLQTVLDLTKKILTYLPQGDSMYLMYDKMVKRLTHRIETYEQFYDNPYTHTASQPKYNSDPKLGLGEYNTEHQDRSIGND